MAEKSNWDDSEIDAVEGEAVAPQPSRGGFLSRVTSIFRGRSKDAAPQDFVSSFGEATAPAAAPTPSRPAMQPRPAAQSGASASHAAANDGRQAVCASLKKLMDTPTAARDQTNYLFILNQNLRALGMAALADMPHRNLKLALQQMDALAIYEVDPTLKALRARIIEVIGHEPEPEPVATPAPRVDPRPAPPRVAINPSAAPAVLGTHAAAATAGAATGLSLAAEELLPVPTVEELTVPALTDEADEFSPSAMRDASGPEVMEGAGLTPFEPVILEDLGLKLNDIPQLRGSGNG